MAIEASLAKLTEDPKSAIALWDKYEPFVTFGLQSAVALRTEFDEIVAAGVPYGVPDALWDAKVAETRKSLESLEGARDALAAALEQGRKGAAYLRGEADPHETARLEGVFTAAVLIGVAVIAILTLAVLWDIFRRHYNATESKVNQMRELQGMVRRGEAPPEALLGPKREWSALDTLLTLGAVSGALLSIAAIIRALKPNKSA